ncbi:MAG: cation:proton antiporter [Cyanobacteria bacterium RI_101]|nr:cation:proton antiporter [Cyanobacteria bacterium RI_101]
MILLTLLWLTLPFGVGFTIYLLPRFKRSLGVLGGLVSLAYSGYLARLPAPATLTLVDDFGVTLILDSLAAFFILTNALVTLAVVAYCWQSERGQSFYAQTLILHGSVNAALISADLISLYVALEVISIAAFLLLADSRGDRVLWVGIRYLFVSNVAMLFYLVGAMLVYQTHHSFAFQGLEGAPAEAWALILMALLAKGGVFTLGFWLPQTHAEADSPVSALMSGAVVKAGVFPLVRLALLIEDVNPLIRLFGVGTALMGVVYGVFALDTKRTLAWSTVSQMGFLLAAPPVAGFYALTHGLVKAALFLVAGRLPSRRFSDLRETGIPLSLWWPGAVAAFSISGFPLLSGFGAKVLTLKTLLPWQEVGMNLAALGTAIIFAKFIFLPRQSQEKTKQTTGFWTALALLLGALVLANGVYYDAYTLENILKPLATIGLGWILYWGIFRRWSLAFSRAPEQFEHLLGAMTAMLMLLFWLGWSRWEPLF